MTDRFVAPTRADFNRALSGFPLTWVRPKGWKQFAIDVGTDREGAVVRVSTTIDVRSSGARRKDANAIDLVLVAEESGAFVLDRGGKPIAETKVLRTSDWEDRVRGRVEKLQRRAVAETLECRSCGGCVVVERATVVCSDCGEILTPDCPDCDEPMRLRRAKGAAFFGCASYPECRGTRRWPAKPLAVPQTEGCGENIAEHAEGCVADLSPTSSFAAEVGEATEVLEKARATGDAKLVKLAAALEEKLNESTGQALDIILGETTKAGKLTLQTILVKRARRGKSRIKVGSRKKRKKNAAPDPLEGIRLYRAADRPAEALTLVEVPEVGAETVPSARFRHHEIAHESLNPVQTAVLPWVERDVNLVLAATTSAGKTVCAEMVMADALKRGAKAIFLSPLKAVSQEKRDDWTDESHPWSERPVSIVTGDYTLTEKRRKELRAADVIVLTSEMLDSKTRRMANEGNDWLLQTLCLSGDSRIALADGRSLTIREIVDGTLDVEVLAFDHESGRVVARRVTGWHRNPLGDRKLVEIACGTASLTCTEDHEVYVRGVGYTPARKLTYSSELEVLDDGQEGSPIRSDVRRQVRSKSRTDSEEQTIGDVSRSGVRQGSRESDGTDQQRSKTFVFDLTVEGEHNYFAQGILVHNCLVVDEAHLLTMEDRGDALECGLMRFTRQNQHARVVLLSATMPNVDELARWLTRLNGKPSVVIRSSWRPTELTIHWPTYVARGNAYHANEESKRDLAIELTCRRYPLDKWIVFVHSKKAGRALVDDLRQEGEHAEFHSGDLGLDRRRGVETGFRYGDLRIVVSTSTLAYGINMPARRVFVLGIHRGLSKVDPIDVRQMVGRAGRVGLDPRGDAYVALPEDRTRPHQTESLRREYSTVGRIESKLNDLDVLAFHLTAEVAEGAVGSEEEAVAWHARSLAALQGRSLAAREEILSAASVMEKLARCGVLKQNGFRYEATGLGRVSSWLYFSPFDVADWCGNFRTLVETDRTRDDHALAWALGKIKTGFDSYLPREHESDMAKLEARLRSKGLDPRATRLPPTVLAFHGLLTGTDYRFMVGQQRSLAHDVPRIMQALELIDKHVLHELGSTYVKLLGVRVRYGATWKEAALCQLPGIGAKRARALIVAGVASIESVAENKRAVIDAVGRKIGIKAVATAREMTE